MQILKNFVYAFLLSVQVQLFIQHCTSPVKHVISSKNSVKWTLTGKDSYFGETIGSAEPVFTVGQAWPQHPENGHLTQLQSIELFTISELWAGSSTGCHINDGVTLPGCSPRHSFTPSQCGGRRKEGEKAVSGERGLEITQQLPSLGIRLDLGKVNSVYNRFGCQETKRKANTLFPTLFPRLSFTPFPVAPILHKGHPRYTQKLSIKLKKAPVTMQQDQEERDQGIR